MTREQIIAELQYYREHWNLAGFEHYGETICNVNAGLIDAAVEALKAQEAHVITANDFIDNPNMDSQGSIPAWIEYRRDDEWEEYWEDTDDEWATVKAYNFDSDGYRCWTSRPSKEQMEATPWN